MASSGQRMPMEKPSSTTTLTHSGSQNSLTEAGSTQSHLHDVRAPELVYNIDEETRMGPETTNDGINPPSSESVLKEQEGKILDSKSAPKEESSTANPSNTPFSALSFIASQYAESDNSSPRSSNSPSGMLDDNGSNLVPKPPESTGHSSDGFETSPLLPDAEAGPKQQTSGVEAEEGKVCVGDIGSGGDASAQCVAQSQPGIASDAPPKMETEVSKDVDVSKDMAQAELAPDEPRVEETGLDKDADVKEHVRDVEMDKEMKKDSDVSTVSKEENMTVKVEAEADCVTEPVSTVDMKDVNDDISEGMSEGVGEVVSKLVSDENDKQQIQDLAAASAGLDNENVTSSQTEPMETAEPMETDDSKEQQGDAEEKMVTEDTDQDREKDTLDVVQSVTDTPEESRREPDADMLMTSDTKLAPNTESDMPSDSPSDSKQQANTDLLHSEDAKVESGVVPNMETAVGEDSRQALDADVVMNEDSIPAPSVGSIMTEGCKLLSHVDSVVSEESKLASNMDSVMSDDSKLVPNVDSVMSEDSKLLSNLDSVLSGGLDESEDFYEVKGPSAVVPFGENANSSMPVMGTKSLLEGENSNFSFVDESSQSNSMVEKPSRPKRARRSSISDIQDSKNEIEDGLQPFPAERVFEYQWPQDGGEWYLLQEQISEYLGVLSFKRKYPDLTRRTCDKLEKEFLREKGVVTETQSDLGLTAIRSEEVYDLMMKDYPDKYHEYATLLHEREKQKISDKHKEYEVAQPKLEKSKMADYMKKAAKSAAEYNRHLLREKREERLAFFDLQTFMIQYPEGRYKKLPPECTKPSAYPVALIPGQFQDHYCSYTSDELRYFPLNTALYDPPKKMSNTLAKPAGSGESSDDSSEDKSGSSSDSSGSGSGSSDSETPAAAAAAAAATAKGNSADTSQPAAVPATPAEPAVTPGKKTGKKVSKTPAKTPAKSPGKVLKGKRKLETNVEEKETSGTASTPLVPTSPAVQPASPAPSKEKVEEDEDKDKCRICKNAVLFLKYKRVETKMIKCSECGKIAHPTCLDLTDKMVQVVTTYPWQCMECKTCVECMDPYDEDKMLFCDRCDRGYHTFCVGLRCLPSGRWECRSCKGVAEIAKSRRGRPIKPT